MVSPGVSIHDPMEFHEIPLQWQTFADDPQPVYDGWYGFWVHDPVEHSTRVWLHWDNITKTALPRLTKHGASWVPVRAPTSLPERCTPTPYDIRPVIS